MKHSRSLIVGKGHFSQHQLSHGRRAGAVLAFGTWLRAAYIVEQRGQFGQQGVDALGAGQQQDTVPYAVSV
jgi:hypothetical protein